MNSLVPFVSPIHHYLFETAQHNEHGSNYVRQIFNSLDCSLRRLNISARCPMCFPLDSDGFGTT